MARPKSQRIGPGLIARHPDGTCTFFCYRCKAWTAEPASWRAARKLARDHAAEHTAWAADVVQPTDRYTLTSYGANAVSSHHPRPLRRLAAVLVVLLLAAVAFTAAGMASRTSSAPAPAPPIGIVTATTAPGPEGYHPTPAGPPTTDRQGQWTAEPDPASSSAGGGR